MQLIQIFPYAVWSSFAAISMKRDSTDLDTFILLQDRPSIVIYQPGMGKFSKQRIAKEKEAHLPTAKLVNESEKKDTWDPHNISRNLDNNGITLKLALICVLADSVDEDNWMCQLKESSCKAVSYCFV